MTLETRNRLAFNSIPENCDLRHPFAIEGNLVDWKQANDRKDGPVKHYLSRGGLFYVKEKR